MKTKKIFTVSALFYVLFLCVFASCSTKNEPKTPAQTVQIDYMAEVEVTLAKFIIEMGGDGVSTPKDFIQDFKSEKVDTNDYLPIAKGMLFSEKYLNTIYSICGMYGAFELNKACYLFEIEISNINNDFQDVKKAGINVLNANINRIENSINHCEESIDILTARQNLVKLGFNENNLSKCTDVNLIKSVDIYYDSISKKHYIRYVSHAGDNLDLTKINSGKIQNEHYKKMYEEILCEVKAELNLLLVSDGLTPQLDSIVKRVKSKS